MCMYGQDIICIGNRYKIITIDQIVIGLLQKLEHFI